MDRLNVLCRTARASDTADMLELTRTIWDGHDYVPQVWAEWLADRDGRLIVAEYQGQVIGLDKLSRQDDGEWWLHGLRVHPDFRGRGVASQLHQAALQTWEATGSGTLRLATGSARLAVQHLCERDRFTKVGEASLFIAADDPPAAAHPSNTTTNRTIPDTRPAGTLPGGNPFAPISSREVAAATEFICRSAAFALQNFLMELGWEWTPANCRSVGATVERGQAWWWRDRDGVLLFYADRDDDEGPLLAFISALACKVEQIGSLLGDFRRLAQQLGYPCVAWIAPLEAHIQAALAATGFRREWDDSVFIYAKTKV